MTISGRRFWTLLFAVGGLACVAVACSSETARPARDSTPERTPPSSQVTTTIANRPPQFRAVPSARAEIGDRYSDAIVATDPDGDEVIVRVGDAPAGFTPVVNTRGLITGFEWQPTEAGEWSVELTATDSEGLVATSDVHLLARAARSGPLVLAMGDGVAAGLGRDRSDFLGTDECFRSEGDAYAVVTTDALIEAGALDAETEVAVVACADATTQTLDLDLRRATSRSGEPLDGEHTQIGWAAALNPTIITLTIGGTTTTAFDVGRFVLASEDDEGNAVAELDRGLLASEHVEVRSNLDDILHALLTTTDAHIAITTYYDPTAADPIGVEGCRGACFVGAMEEIMGVQNEAIVRAAEADTSGRVSLVRLDGGADVWEASNGVGPDFVRDGFGIFDGLVDRFTGGSTPTCADDGEPAEDLVSSLDCVHPNSAGHRRIADLVTGVLLSI